MRQTRTKWTKNQTWVSPEASVKPDYFPGPAGLFPVQFNEPILKYTSTLYALHN